MPAIDDRDPYEYERPFWAPIGQFVMAFGYLERDIGVSITRLLQLHDRLQGGALLTKIKSTDALIDLFEPLLKALNREPERVEKAKELVQRLKEANTFRNGLLHGPWLAYFVEDGQFQKLSKKSPSAATQPHKFTVTEIGDRTREVMKVQGDLGSFVQDVLKEHRAKRGYTLWHDELP